MAYTKQGFTNGMTLEAKQLVVIEDAIIEMQNYDGKYVQGIVNTVMEALPRYNGEVEPV